MTAQQVITSIDGFLAMGDEAGARAFLVENMIEFPQALRDSLSWSFLEDSLKGEQYLLSLKHVAVDTLAESA